MVCYRRHGHNEGDDPSYTQPLMYKAIAERRSVRKLYVEALVKRGELTVEEAEGALADFQTKLQVALDETRAQAPEAVKAAEAAQAGRRAAARRDRRRPRHARRDLRPPHRVSPTASRRTRSWSASSRPAPRRTTRPGEVDWATAEALAIGSLVLEGTPVRLAGEDSRRGTFSQRHAALIDYENENVWIPLNTLARRDRPASGCTTACSASTPRSASSTATRTPTTTRW